MATFTLKAVKSINSKIITIAGGPHFTGSANYSLSNEIAIACKKINIKCIQKRNISETNKCLLNELRPQEIIISGSLYLVGKVRNLYI